MAERLTEDKVGKLAYEIYVVEDGQETLLESVGLGAHDHDDDGLEYLHGWENIVPGLEKTLEGQETGFAFDITLKPEEAYGEFEEDQVIEIAKDEFEFDEADVVLEAGMEIEMMDDDGDIIEGTVVEIKENVVVVDMNPPLAGKTVRYKGSLLSVRAATEEELDWGFPNSLLSEMFGDDEEDFEGDE